MTPFIQRYLRPSTAVAAAAVMLVIAIGAGAAAGIVTRPTPTPIPTPVPTSAPTATPEPDTGPLVFQQPLTAGCASDDATWVAEQILVAHLDTREV